MRSTSTYWIKTFLKSSLYLLLFVMYIRFYCADTIFEYLEGKTTFAKTYQTNDVQEVPTILMCIDPPFKVSKVSQFGYKSMSELLDDTKEKYLWQHNLSIWEMYQELSYKLERDYRIYLISDFSNILQNKLKGGFNDLKSVTTNGSVMISEIATYRNGMCLLFESNLPIHTNESLLLPMVLFNKTSLKVEDYPRKVSIYLTDTNGWQGIVDDDWIYTKPEKYDLPLNRRLEYVALYDFKLMEIKKKYLTGVDNPTECQRSLMLTIPCSPLCFPLNYNYILGLPACYNFNQTDCINRALYGNKNILAARYHCLKPKETVEYKGKPYENTYNLLNGSGIALYFQFNRLEKEVKEEIYVINTRELIASIGGSLGLFIGFSCYTYSAFFIDKLCSYFQTI